MSTSRTESSGKSMTTSSPTFAFRFRTGDEELEELQLDSENITKNDCECVDSSRDDAATDDKSENENGASPVKEYWNRLGKRSTSIDSNSESSFSNSSDTWRKFNELKGKITKTVEEKISEMKIDRHKSGNMLGITTSRNRLVNSKENSSISDSEDTSESSRLSEPWKDAEDPSGSPQKSLGIRSETISGLIDTLLENVKPEVVETEPDEVESELRNRKSSKLSTAVKLSDIKISTAKCELNETLTEEVESGVEADETFTAEVRYDELPSGVPPNDGGSKGGLPPFRSDEVSSKTLKDYVCELLIKNNDKVLIFLSPDPAYVQKGPFQEPNFRSLPPLKIPPNPVVKGTWFNAYTKEYDPDLYSVTQTIPVFVELNEYFLKLSYTKAKINKRATFDEPEYKLNFTDQQTYDIRNCNVLLLPDGLARRRMFSKKYPIVIILRPNSVILDKEKELTPGTVEEEDTDLEGTETDDTLSQNQESAYGKMYLNLFARCDREKEEWYRKLLAATKIQTPDLSKLEVHSSIKTLDEEDPSVDDTGSGVINEPSTPFEDVYFDPDTALTEEYLRYMTKFADIETREEIRSPKMRRRLLKRLLKKRKVETVLCPVPDVLPTLPSKKNLESSSYMTKNRVNNSQAVNDAEEQIEAEIDPTIQVQWFSALVNRILFDVFRSPFWTEKIREKMQKKLTSIRLPYYVEDIEITELDLGKMGPKFHRVSQPVLDDRGLWFDMDVTFDGLVKVTIQTQLNLLKLQKGSEGQEEDDALLTQEKSKGEEKKTETIRLSKDVIMAADSVEMSEKARKRVKNGPSRGILKSSLNEELSANTVNSNEAEEEFINEWSEFAMPLDKPQHEPPIPEVIEAVPTSSASALIESPTEKPITKKRSPMYDSELEDSAESSDEDDFDEDSQGVSVSPQAETEQVPYTPKRRLGRKSSKKIFRIVENVAQSKYFKSVAQSKYIQKAIAGVSETKLKLCVEVKSCIGTLAINIPPPPSDRLWYGFREMPKVWLSAHPKIGKKSVRFTHIKNFLEKKIMQEFKKVMVLPNMDEFILPINPPLPSSSTTQVAPSPTADVTIVQTPDTLTQSSSHG